MVECVVELSLIIFSFYSADSANTKKKKQSLGFRVARDQLKLDNVYCTLIDTIHEGLHVLKELNSSKRLHSLIDLAMWQRERSKFTWLLVVELAEKILHLNGFQSETVR